MRSTGRLNSVNPGRPPLRARRMRCACRERSPQRSAAALRASANGMSHGPTVATFDVRSDAVAFVNVKRVSAWSEKRLFSELTACASPVAREQGQAIEFWFLTVTLVQRFPNPNRCLQVFGGGLGSEPT